MANNKNSETISDRIKQLKELLNMNQKQLAHLLGIKASLISDYERGLREPSRDVLIRMIKYLNININWLLTGAGNKLLDDSSSQNLVVSENGINYNTLDELELSVFQKFAKMDNKDWKIIKRILDSELTNRQKEKLFEILSVSISAFKIETNNIH